MSCYDCAEKDTIGKFPSLSQHFVLVERCYFFSELPLASELYRTESRMNQRLSMLVVEDERSLARLWAIELGDLVESTLSHSLADARLKLNSRAFDVVLLDLRLPDGDGIELLRELHDRGDKSAVIILTGFADVDSAIEALRLGAFDIITKPCKISDIEKRLHRIASEHSVENQNISLSRQLRTMHIDPSQLIGSSPALADVRKLIGRCAPGNAAVLITGETGTGKEIAARMVHSNSNRSGNLFVPVNCSSLDKASADSEIFGHRKGAFPGAETDMRGLVQTAAGGTLFLDEIADLSLEVQSKFLRLVETREGRRAGDSESYHADVRIIAGTHKDLRKEVAAGRFREELYYRLAGFELKMPPLRTIPDDIVPIAMHLLEVTSGSNSKAVRLSPAAISAMRYYSWPGNVRELRNAIERARILCEAEEITPEHLNLPTSYTPSRSSQESGTLASMEWGMIQDALLVNAGNKTAAARKLGISLRTLYNKLEAKAAESKLQSSASVETEV